MSQLPVAEDPSTCEPQGWKSMSTRVISAVSDANLMVVSFSSSFVCSR
jgi:hypothetical protein